MNIINAILYICGMTTVMISDVSLAHIDLLMECINNNIAKPLERVDINTIFGSINVGKVIKSSTGMVYNASEKTINTIIYPIYFVIVKSMDASIFIENAINKILKK